MQKTIAITGATGFIGEELTNHLLASGNKVLALSRKKPVLKHSNLDWKFYDLEKELNAEELKGIDVVIHCAYQIWTKEQSDSDSINLKATRTLANYCEENQIQFVFLSSFSAHAKATSHYGTHKFQLENELTANHLVIKPGLVLGKKGLAYTLKNTIATKKIIPILGNGLQPVQWIGVKELCEGIENAIEKKMKGTVLLASEEPVSFLKLNETIAAQAGRSPWYIFIHPFIVKLLLPIFGKKFNVQEENLKGLMQLRTFDTQADLLGVEINVNTLEETLKNQVI
jgi:nucleoside-diphosphate-sugar epimerase